MEDSSLHESVWKLQQSRYLTFHDRVAEKLTQKVCEVGAGKVVSLKTLLSENMFLMQTALVFPLDLCVEIV